MIDLDANHPAARGADDRAAARPSLDGVTAITTDGVHLGIAHRHGLDLVADPDRGRHQMTSAPEDGAVAVWAASGDTRGEAFSGSRAMAFRDGVLWTVTQPPAPQSLIGVEGATGEQTTTQRIDDELRDVDQLTIVARRVFVAATTRDRRAVVELTDDGTRLLTAGVAEPPYGEPSLRAVDDELWIVVGDQGRLVRMDPVADRLIAEHVIDVDGGHRRVVPFAAGTSGRLLVIRRPRFGQDLPTDLVAIEADGSVSTLEPGGPASALDDVLSLSPLAGAVTPSGRLLFGLRDGRVLAVNPAR